MADAKKEPDSLESSPDSSSSVIETNSLENGNSTTTSTSSDTPPKAPKKGNVFKRIFNIYLLAFFLVLVIVGAVILISVMSNKTVTEPKVASQSLSASTLKQLATTDATVGDPKQTLSVQSNAVFAGKVLIQDSLDVAGQIHVSGALTLPGITVSGNSSFDSVSVNKTLSIGGDASVLGQLNVKKNLAVSGGGTFGGSVTAPQIATNKLQILGDLTLTSHIIAGGVTPNRTIGSAVGAGGTASVSGSDSAGTININTGSGTAVGCFVSLTFATKYNNTPHVVITPTSSTAASIDYYVNRTTSGFSVCVGGSAVPAAGAVYSFDYIVLG